MKHDVTILAINGSLNPASQNAGVAKIVAEQRSKGVSIDLFNGLRDVPMFDPSLTGEALSPVNHLRSAVGAANGLVIVTPEYAHSMPGVLKNALDWLVGSGELANKPVAIITASTTPTGGLRAQIALIQTLLAQSAQIVALLPIAGSKLKIDESGDVIHQPTIRRIRETLFSLVEHCSTDF